MKKISGFSGKLSSTEHQKKIEVILDLIEYKEDRIYYVYSPALDLIGYGNNAKEARNSWETVVEEYFRYTLNKKTLIKDLQNHGWKVTKNQTKYNPPTLSWMLQHNKELIEMYDSHNFHKISKPIVLPLQHLFA